MKPGCLGDSSSLHPGATHRKIISFQTNRPARLSHAFPTAFDFMYPHHQKGRAAAVSIITSSNVSSMLFDSSVITLRDHHRNSRQTFPSIIRGDDSRMKLNQVPQSGHIQQSIVKYCSYKVKDTFLLTPEENLCFKNPTFSFCRKLLLQNNQGKKF